MKALFVWIVFSFLVCAGYGYYKYTPITLPATSVKFYSNKFYGDSVLADTSNVKSYLIAYKEQPETIDEVKEDAVSATKQIIQNMVRSHNSPFEKQILISVNMALMSNGETGHESQSIIGTATYNYLNDTIEFKRNEQGSL